MWIRWYKESRGSGSQRRRATTFKGNASKLGRRRTICQRALGLRASNVKLRIYVGQLCMGWPLTLESNPPFERARASTDPEAEIYFKQRKQAKNAEVWFMGKSRISAFWVENDVITKHPPADSCGTFARRPIQVQVSNGRDICGCLFNPPSLLQIRSCRAGFQKNRWIIVRASSTRHASGEERSICYNTGVLVRPGTSVAIASQSCYRALVLATQHGYKVVVVTEQISPNCIHLFNCTGIIDYRKRRGLLIPWSSTRSISYWQSRARPSNQKTTTS
jgi:hypothetical protein